MVSQDVWLSWGLKGYARHCGKKLGGGGSSSNDGPFAMGQAKSAHAIVDP